MYTLAFEKKSVQIRDVGRFLAKFNPWTNTFGNRSVRLHCLRIHPSIIPTQCFYRLFGDFDWSVGKIKLFLHFDKSPCVGIFDNCLDITVVDCVNNNELYIKL